MDLIFRTIHNQIKKTFEEFKRKNKIICRTGVILLDKAVRWLLCEWSVDLFVSCTKAAWETHTQRTQKEEIKTDKMMPLRGRMSIWYENTGDTERQKE